jgi:hypothetical protein
MWRYAIVLSAVGLMMLPAKSQAQFKQGDWELTLSGQGANDKDFETGSASAVGSLGYFFSDQLEVGLRQGITWADGGSAWNGDTRLAADFHFDFARWQPFLGANIGYTYGDNVDDSWIAGPEGGVKYFMNSTTFVEAIVSYEFSLNNGFDSGAFFYGLGIGVRL